MITSHSQKFVNGKNANNKVNRWGLELATYNITFEWISGAKNKAADCLSYLVKLPQTTSTCYQSQIQMHPLSIQEAKLDNAFHWILPQQNQVLHLKSHQYHTQHLNLQQQTD